MKKIFTILAILVVLLLIYINTRFHQLVDA